MSARWRWATVLVSAAAIVAIAAPSAHAKIWFGDIGGRVLEWDARVTSTIAGCPGNDSCGTAVEGTTVYLRRGRTPRNLVPRRGLRRVARVSSAGRIAFRVPRVAPGRYQLVARLRGTTDGRFFRVSGTFRIVR